MESNKMPIGSGYEYKVNNFDTSVPMTVYGNCQMTEVQYDYNFEDEANFIAKFDIEEDEKTDDRKGKMCSSARVVVEKLPDSVVQQYLAKKVKNNEKMDFGKILDSNVQHCVKRVKNYSTMNFGKVSDSSVQHRVKEENYKIDDCAKNSLVKQYLAKKENFETDKFVKEMFSPIMQQCLANTEMGCLTDNFMEQIAEPQEYPARPNNYTTDSLIKSLSDNVSTQYPFKMEGNEQTDNCAEHFAKSILQQCCVETDEDYNKADEFMKSLSYPPVQECIVDPTCSIMQEFNVDVETVDDFMEKPMNFSGQENIPKKINIRKVKSSNNRRQRRKNLTTKLCQRICPDCHTYVQSIHKASAKVKCDNCNTLTLFECKKCKKLAHTYSGIADHLLHRCEARQLYKCAHCKYSVRKKNTLVWHINKTHEKSILRNLIAQNRKKNTEKIKNTSHQSSEYDEQFENLIILKKQKEMKHKSEWYIENVKRSDSRVNKSMDSSVPLNTISTLPTQNSTSVKRMAQLYCKHCNKKIAIDGPHTKTEIYCRMCGTVLLFKCLKCHSTCESYHTMKHHLKKVCTFKENNRESFHCPKCNYRSFFQGLVINHHNKIHSFENLPKFSSNNLI